MNDSEMLPALSSIARALDSLSGLLNRVNESASATVVFPALSHEFAGVSSLGPTLDVLGSAFPQGTTSAMPTDVGEFVAGTSEESRPHRPTDADANSGKPGGNNTAPEASSAASIPSLEVFAALGENWPQILEAVEASSLSAAKAMDSVIAASVHAIQANGLLELGPGSVAPALDFTVTPIEKLANGDVPGLRDTRNSPLPLIAEAGPVADSSFTAGDSASLPDFVRSALIGAWSRGNGDGSEMNEPVELDGTNRALAELHQLLETFIRDLPRSLAEAMATRSPAPDQAPGSVQTGKESSAAPGIACSYRGVEAVLANTPVSLGVSGVVAGAR